MRFASSLILLAALALSSQAALASEANEKQSQEADSIDPILSLKTPAPVARTPSWVLQPTSLLMAPHHAIERDSGGGGEIADRIGRVAGLLGILTTEAAEITATYLIYSRAPTITGQAEDPGFKTAALTFATTTLAIPLMSSAMYGASTLLMGQSNFLDAFVPGLLGNFILKTIIGLIALPFLTSNDLRPVGRGFLITGAVLSVPVMALAHVFSGKPGG